MSNPTRQPQAEPDNFRDLSADDNAPALRDVSTQQPRLPDSEAQPGKGERPFFALCRAALPHLQTRLDQAVWMLLVSYCRVWVGASRIGKCSPGHARMCADLRLDERALRRSLARIVGGGRLQIRKRGRTETAEHVVAPFGFGGLVALTDEDPGWIDQEPENPNRVETTRLENPNRVVSDIQTGLFRPPKDGDEGGVANGASVACGARPPSATSARSRSAAPAASRKRFQIRGRRN